MQAGWESKGRLLKMTGQGGWLKSFSRYFLLANLISSIAFHRGYAQLGFGFKQLGASCKESAECNRILWLECVDGLCRCTEPESTVYDPRFRRCFAKRESSCFRYGIGPFCQPGLICNLARTPANRTRPVFPFNGACMEVLGKPVLRPPAVQVPANPAPVIIGGLGATCGPSPAGQVKCADGMVCGNGRCTCNPLLGQYYVDGEKACRISPGAPCNPDWQSECREGHECRPGRQQGTFLCSRCRDGTSLEGDNLCRPSYLSACDFSSDDSPCEADKFLDCLDGSCICSSPLHQMYSAEKGTCVTLSGSRCRDGLPPCTAHADCVTGRCLCREGYYETSLRTCTRMLRFGTECKDGQCDETRGMVCRDSKCVCLDPTMIFDEERFICESRPGDICGQVSLDGIEKPISAPCTRGFICAETAPGSFRCTSP